jgi:plasmid stability protein
MAKTIQVRDVDDDVYRTLRRRAADEDLSLSAYLRKQFEGMAGTRTWSELFAEADERRRRGMSIDTDTIVRVQRQIRDGE